VAAAGTSAAPAATMTVNQLATARERLLVPLSFLVTQVTPEKPSQQMPQTPHAMSSCLGGFVSLLTTYPSGSARLSCGLG